MIVAIFRNICWNFYFEFLLQTERSHKLVKYKNRWYFITDHQKLIVTFFCDYITSDKSGTEGPQVMLDPTYISHNIKSLSGGAKWGRWLCFFTSCTTSIVIHLLSLVCAVFGVTFCPSFWHPSVRRTRVYLCRWVLTYVSVSYHEQTDSPWPMIVCSFSQCILSNVGFFI